MLKICFFYYNSSPGSCRNTKEFSYLVCNIITNTAILFNVILYVCMIVASSYL